MIREKGDPPFCQGKKLWGENVKRPPVLANTVTKLFKMKTEGV